jgi:hypothetical protein
MLVSKIMSSSMESGGGSVPEMAPVPLRFPEKGNDQDVPAGPDLETAKLVSQIQERIALLPEGELKERLVETLNTLEEKASEIEDEVGKLSSAPRSAFGKIREYFQGWGGGSAMLFTAVGAGTFQLVRGLTGSAGTIEPHTMAIFTLLSVGSGALSYALSHIINKEKESLKGPFWDWLRKDFKRVVLVAVVIASAGTALARTGIEDMLSHDAADTIAKAEALENSGSLSKAVEVAAR